MHRQNGKVQLPPLSGQVKPLRTLLQGATGLQTLSQGTTPLQQFVPHDQHVMQLIVLTEVHTQEISLVASNFYDAKYAKYS